MRVSEILKLSRVFFLFTLVWIGSAANLQAANDPSLWKALQTEGHIALMRHAVAPGMGDPQDFVVGDCTTQRNLSAGGQAQARRIGDHFRANGIEEAHVSSSEWCRCLETAELLNLGAVEALPMLNSFFRDFDREEAQTSALAAWIDQHNLDKTHILVTHQVNITALTGVFPASGEIVVVKRKSGGEIEVVGTIRID